MTMEVAAPWKDFAGADIYEGDIIEHPDGQRGLVVCLREHDLPEDRWRVDYGYPHGVDLSRLCLQIGDKGQAVVRNTPPQGADRAE